MIIEAACSLIPVQLSNYKGWEKKREEELSRILAGNSEMILRELGVRNPRDCVEVEVRNAVEDIHRCDIVIDNAMLNLRQSELNHKEYIEVKYFRSNPDSGNKTNLAKSLWTDFRKVITNGTGFPYSVVLCEDDFANVLPQKDDYDRKR